MPAVSSTRAGRIRRAARSSLRWGIAAAAAGLLALLAVRGVRAWTIGRSIDWLDDADLRLRDTAETRLRTLDDPTPLFAALGHERAEVRRRMVWIVAARGAASVPALVRSLGDANAAVRVAVCDALGALPGDEAAAALVVAMGDPAPDVRRAATAALAARTDVPRIQPDATADGDARWRVAALRATRWLWSRQTADGGWHGAAYGVFEDGRSVTPFVLATLLDVPIDVHPGAPDQVRRAFEFLAANPPESATFSTYATSLALRCLVRSRPEGWRTRARAHAEWLKRAQFAESVGCGATDPAYGAWGLDAAKPGLFARADLSATSFALRALAEAGSAVGVGSDDPVFSRARVFVDRCNNAGGDGGYFLSTNSPAANKAGACGEAAFRSYGSATADGALARAALTGAPDPIAVRWLLANPEATRTPGFAKDDASGWNLGVMHYYAAERASLRDALRRADARAAAEWETAIVATLLARQRADGSWANEVSLMREDEPLVATGFAVQTLVGLRAARGSDAVDVQVKEVR